MKHDDQIVGFVCKFCALLSFNLGPTPDSAAKIHLIELPCAGRIDPRVILAAFEEGADGVFVAGCLSHECLNLTGSSRAGKRIERVQNILDVVGLGRERLMMYYVSGTNGPRFAPIATEMTERVKQLGANPLRGKKQGERRYES